MNYTVKMCNDLVVLSNYWIIYNVSYVEAAGLDPCSLSSLKLIGNWCLLCTLCISNTDNKSSRIKMCTFYILSDKNMDI